jgi:hypothetical protein
MASTTRRRLLVDVSKAQDVRERHGEGGRGEGGGDMERREEACVCTSFVSETVDYIHMHTYVWLYKYGNPL